MTSYSVVICSVDPVKYRQASASWRRALDGADCEIVGIHDARSLSEGYTRGLARAKGELVVFSHDDVDVVTPDAATRLATHLQQYDVVGIAGTQRLVGGAWYLTGDPYDYMLLITPHPETRRPVLLAEGPGPLVVAGIQALDGVFFAARADVAREIGFDAATFDHFHLYDLDFTFRAHLAGRKLAVCRDVLLVHASQGSFDPRWDLYRQRFEAKFRAQLAPPVQRREPRVVNAPLDAALFADAARRAELAKPEALQALVDRLGPAQRAGPSR